MQIQENQVEASSNQEPLPNIQNKDTQKRKSSLRSLKELQQRKKLNLIYGGRPSQLEGDEVAGGKRDKFKSVIDLSFHSQRDKGDDRNLMMMPDLQLSESKKLIQAAMRKRSPSDFLRRKSTPVTPKKNMNDITVPMIDQTQYQLIQMAGNQPRNNLKLSTVQQANDINLFPSLSQTPKFDLRPTQGTAYSLQGPQFRHQRLRQSNSRAGSRSFLRPQSQNNRQQQAWEKTNANQFQLRNNTPKDVLTQLQQIIQTKLNLEYSKPSDLDSTEPLDSFIDSFYQIVDNRVYNYNENIKEKQHLATGIRSEVCEDFLTYVSSLQGRNKVLIDTVEYYAEHINRLIELEQDKLEKEQQISQLTQDKEALFLSKYDLERKISEIVDDLSHYKSREQDLSSQLKSLNKKFEAKKQECESLTFRIKHIEDLSNMMEPPMSHQSIVAEANGESDPAYDNFGMSYPEAEKIRGLEAINKKLETELGLMRQALQKQQEVQFTDNVDHFVKIQELFNKAQIENKQLRTTNKKIESKLESKERLISHLESKVTTIMVEKEDVIVKLKSEIVLMKNQLEFNEKTFDNRLQELAQKFQNELNQKHSGQIKKLSQEKDDLLRDKEDLNSKLTLLQQEYDKITSEFSKYRNEISIQDNENKKNLSELEQKLRTISIQSEQQVSQMQERIESLENHIQVIQKHNTILETKLNFVLEQTEVMIKQKQLILDDTDKSRNALMKESDTIESQMMNENQNKDYLISVKKAVKQSQSMIELGVNALNKVTQIISFLKIEELKLMINNYDKQQQISGTANIINKDENNRTNEKDIIIDDKQIEDIDQLNQDLIQQDLTITDQQNTIQAKQKYSKQQQLQVAHADPINALQLRQFIAQPSGIQNMNAINDRNEDYFFTYCPIELSSILIKLIADLLTVFDITPNQDQLPEKIQNLLSIALAKSDNTIEQEIYQKFLQPTRELFEIKFFNMTSDITTLQEKLDQLQKFSQRPSIVLLTPPNEQLKENMDEDDIMANMAAASNIAMKSRQNNYSHLKNSSNITSKRQSIISNSSSNMDEDKTGRNKNQQTSGAQSRQFSNNLPPSPRMNRQFKASRSYIEEENDQPSSDSKLSKRTMKKQRQDALDQSSQEIESLKLSLLEYKQRSKEIQLQLAQKVVILEEQLEQFGIEKQNEINEIEQQHKQELENTKLGLSQRESKLLAKISQYTDKAHLAEQQMKQFKERCEYLENELRILQTNQMEIDKIIQKKDRSMEVFKENVMAYVNVRQNQRNLFSLVFQQNEINQSFINEQMLQFYLNKCIKIDKIKFRFIETDITEVRIDSYNQNASQIKSSQQKEVVEIVRILIEIVDDQHNIDKYLNALKNQIREGISILYDLSPLYISLNLGQTGLNDLTNLNDFHLIRKMGALIQQQNYLVSFMRHRQNPLIFKIIAINFEAGEEYILDLFEKDIYELTEGRVHLLQKEEPSQILELILESLTILNMDGMKILACEHKIFFNTIFQETITTNKGAKKGNNLFISSFSQSEIRNQLIKENLNPKANQINLEYKNTLNRSTETQTEFKETIFYQKQNQKYKGRQKIGKYLEFKIKIHENTLNNSILLTFDELQNSQKAQLCLFDYMPKINSQQKEQYIIYSECIKVEEAYFVLITCEKYKKDGFLIKMHDLKELQSVEFFLIRKSNGQFIKMGRENDITNLNEISKREDLRNLIYNTTFTITIPTNQVLLANMIMNNEENMMRGLEEMSPSGSSLDFENNSPKLTNSLQLPSFRKNGVVKRASNGLKNLNMQLKANTKSVIREKLYEAVVNNMLLQKLDKGELLYRNIYTVRCIFEGSEEQEQTSLISFYAKRDLISVEVFLYKDPQKMSIASQVSSYELFGTDHNDLIFTQKAEMLDNMMEMLYVLSENNQYHLKVENEAVPISQIIYQRQMALSSDSGTLSMAAMEKAQIESRIKDIQENRNELLVEPRSQLISTYAYIENRYFKYNVYFIMRAERETSQFNSSPRKRQSLLKKQIDRQITNLENFVEENFEFDQIYIEATNDKEETYRTLVTQKTLINMLSQNSSENLKTVHGLLKKNKEMLIETLKKNSHIRDGELVIETNQVGSEIYQEIIRNQVGGHYVRRNDTQQRIEIEEKLLTKKVLLNQEIEMSEFQFDIKLYQILLTSDLDTPISFSIEIFSLTHPDLLYCFNYPINHFSSSLNSPMHISIDIINLIENPFQNDKLISPKNNIHSQQDPSLHTKDSNEDPKQNYQDIFSKYMDNNLVLVVTEHVFPQKITIQVVEPNSKLMWQYNFDPSSAPTSDVASLRSDLGMLQIIDQQTLESYIAMIMNEIAQFNENQSNYHQLQIMQFENKEDHWIEHGDSENIHYDLVKSKVLIENNGISLSLNVAKIGHDALKLTLHYVNKQSTQNQHFAQKQVESIKFVVSCSQRNKFMAKLINLKDFDRDLMLTSLIKGRDILVKVIDINQDELSASQVLYQYKFTDKDELEQETYSQSLQTWNELYELFDRSIQQQYNQKTLLNIKSLLLDQQQQSANTESMIMFGGEDFSLKRKQRSLRKNEIKPTVLHRKTFYDETQERLIIVSVIIDSIVEKKKSSRTYGNQKLQSVREVEQFKLLIHEPETKRTTQFLLGLNQCFLEDELMGINRKDLNQLKKLAKILVEERAIIKRAGDDINDTVVSNTPKLALHESSYSQQMIQQQQVSTYSVEITMGHVIPIINEIQNTIEAASGTIERPQSQPNNEFENGGNNIQKKNSIPLSPNNNRGPLHQENTGINEIHEEDEEEEDEEIIPRRGNSLNQRRQEKNKQQHQSVIPEESQEEIEDSPQYTTQEKRERSLQEHSNDKKFRYNESKEEEEVEDNSQERNDEQDIEDEEDDDDDDAESQKSVLFEKQLPKDQVLEIVRINSQDIRVRKRSQLDQEILKELTLSKKFLDQFQKSTGQKQNQDEDEFYENLASYFSKAEEFK